jgi:hypothetical protein
MTGPSPLDASTGTGSAGTAQDRGDGVAVVSLSRAAVIALIAVIAVMVSIVTIAWAAVDLVGAFARYWDVP